MKETVNTVTIGGQDLRYAILGPDDAERSLLVFNGIGASLDSVFPLAKHFARTRIVTFDVPGVGGSPTPVLPYRFTGLSRMIVRALDKLGFGKVDVFGVSWGGAAAQQFAHDYPERTQSLILAATSAGFVMVPGNLKVLSKMATPKRYLSPDYMVEVGPDIYGGQLRFSDAVLREHASALKPGNNRGYLYQLLAGVGWTSWVWLPQLKMPAMIVMGDDDPIVPIVNGRILAERLPDAKLVTMPCGHLFILTSPAETAALIEDFIFAPEAAKCA
ncbi:poly(3-hydroxyalkanoate) depolymerase [Roseibium hamelinense]|uniref:Poly(3-hydroxyalkanoate) depolymerase n=1 Tax=Roseibium hamelinense TaxID=150831 RepID=A0A562SIA0_9HYPH|nr:poly(3-hydroxyalkanoate) depolymerase [Roseibium hamelinense]MTI43875.1 poly(3-hydroxyalkanoate) depolymerase [Roseibium hamelinense]TWI80833.1 poly(3-hydroxyalkanoate) depolymerase [Roseibium hamelinense]